MRNPVRSLYFMTWLLLSLVQVSSLRGTVVSAESGEPLGFSIVTLAATQARLFTDSAGTFSISDLRPGIYLLSVRQIAYAPLDTTIVVARDATTSVRLQLRHLAIE